MKEGLKTILGILTWIFLCGFFVLITVFGNAVLGDRIWSFPGVVFAVLYIGYILITALFATNWLMTAIENN